jgi:hypothetical protein
MEKTPLGSISFFTWFGFRGRKFTAEDDKIGAKAEEELRKKRKAGEDIPDEDDEELDEDEYEYEVFPTGDDLAVAIAEDLWPGAIQYFSKLHLPPPPPPLKNCATSQPGYAHCSYELD